MVSKLMNIINPLMTYHFDDVDIYIIKDPKSSFMAKSNKEIAEEIIGQIDQVVTSGFGHELGDGIDGTLNHVIETSMISVAVCSGKIVGFASCKLFPFTDYSVFFLHGVAIDDEHKGRKIGFRLVSLLLSMSGMDYIALTTQNPIMYCLVEKLSHELNPSLGVLDCRNTLPLSLLRRLLIVLDRPGFLDEASLVYHDLYSDCLYEKIPSSNRKEVNDFFSKTLEVDVRKQTKKGLFLLARVKK